MKKTCENNQSWNGPEIVQPRCNGSIVTRRVQIKYDTGYIEYLDLCSDCTAILRIKATSHGWKMTTVTA